jgi:hypothetical protein
MSKRLVSMSPDLVEQMERHDAWPPYKVFLKWVRENDMRMRKQGYAQMRNGKLVLMRYVVAFSSYLYECLERSDDSKSAKMFTDYLRSLGVANALEQNPDQLAELLIPQLQRDWLMDDTRTIAEFIISRRDDTYAKECEDEADINKAVRWMFITLGRERNESKPSMSQKDAIEVAEDFLKCSLEAYQQSAMAWHTFSKWTVVWVIDSNDQPKGMSVVLPLKPSAYTELKNGERMFWATRARHMSRRSKHLQIEAFGTRPLEDGGTPEVTDFGAMSLLTQVGALSHMGLSRMFAPRYALAAPATPVNLRRLKSSGYTMVKEQILDSQIDVYEKQVRYVGRDLALNMLLNGLGRKYGNLTRPSQCKKENRG